jgi:hypothetical protein
MARYHAGFSTPAAAAGAAYADFRTTSTDRAHILEIGLFLNAATASSISLARSTTLGTTSTTVAGVAGEPGEPAATMLVGTAWSGAPAGTGVPIRKITLPANIGAGVVWGFGYNDLIIPISASLVLLNFGAGAGSVLNGYVVWDE